MMPCVVEMMDLECSERYSSSVTRMSSIRNWRWAKILLDGSRRLPPYRVHSGWLLDPKNHVAWALNTVTRTKRWTHKDFCSRDRFVKLKVLHNFVFVTNSSTDFDKISKYHLKASRLAVFTITRFIVLGGICTGLGLVNKWADHPSVHQRTPILSVHNSGWK